MRRLVVLGMTAIVLAAACNDSTGPKATRVTRRIYNIRVPASAGTTDSIHIAFDYERSNCDTALVVEARPAAAETRFAVSSIPMTGTCPYSLRVANIRMPFVYIVAPPHASPYTAKFAEPGEADSVRVVQPLQ